MKKSTASQPGTCEWRVGLIAGPDGHGIIVHVMASTITEAMHVAEEAHPGYSAHDAIPCKSAPLTREDRDRLGLKTLNALNKAAKETTDDQH